MCRDQGDLGPIEHGDKSILSLDFFRVLVPFLVLFGLFRSGRGLLVIVGMELRILCAILESNLRFFC